MTVLIRRSDPIKVFIYKLAGPAFCLVVSLLLINQNFPDFDWFTSLFLIAGLFGASLAIVELRGDALRYRRLFKWTVVPQDDIVSARAVLPPLIGSMRLKRFVFPWGRLYFVLDSDTEPNPFRKSEFPLLRHMRREPIRERQAVAESTIRAIQSQVSAAIVGALINSVRLAISRPVPQEPSPNAVIEIVSQIIQFFETFEGVCIFFVLFTVLAVCRYRRRDAWLYAFLAGGALPFIMRLWFS